jgi:cold shock CspA family protein/uncharacterized LabA/DUF88 family protein
MKNASHDNGLLRIGVFYDGTYFSHVSNYYMYEHERKARISITGLHAFIRDEVARQEGADKRFCQIVDAHYFRGRFSAKAAYAQDSLYRERQFDDVLIREGVTMHFLPLSADRVGDVTEKGIDVWFALEAFELAVHKRFDVSVLLTGDGDFVPLVRKLNTLGTRVMLLAWDFEYERDGKPHSTRTSQALINEVTYPVMMSDEIDSRGRKKDPAIASLFVQKSKEQAGIAGVVDIARTAAIEDGVGPGMRTGTIVNLNLDRGFGFVRPDGGGENLFFHFSSLVDCQLTDIQQGTAVIFHVVNTDRGLNASGVRLHAE